MYTCELFDAALPQTRVANPTLIYCSCRETDYERVLENIGGLDDARKGFAVCCAMYSEGLDFVEPDDGTYTINGITFTVKGDTATFPTFTVTWEFAYDSEDVDTGWMHLIIQGDIPKDIISFLYEDVDWVYFRSEGPTTPTTPTTTDTTPIKVEGTLSPAGWGALCQTSGLDELYPPLYMAMDTIVEPQDGTTDTVVVCGISARVFNYDSTYYQVEWNIHAESDLVDVIIVGSIPDSILKINFESKTSTGPVSGTVRGYEYRVACPETLETIKHLVPKGVSYVIKDKWIRLSAPVTGLFEIQRCEERFRRERLGF